MDFSKKKRMDLLVDRANQLKLAREYFEKKNILEVQVPILVKYPTLDANIESMRVQVLDNIEGYLHTSPEYLMKRLLSYEFPDIYYLGSVFRKNEMGKIHNPEFTMVEWYRRKIDLQDFIEEVLEFLKIFLKDLKVTYFTYQNLFLEKTKIDIFLAKKQDLLDFLQEKNIEIEKAKELDFDTLLQLIFTLHIEPSLTNLTIIQDYPASQAMLSRVIEKEHPIAKRFEIFYEGVELANGYHELLDAKEQERRFHQANKKRAKPLPIDPAFIQALKRGIGDCCGVAIGFDRIMMLRHNLSSLDGIFPFLWKEL